MSVRLGYACINTQITPGCNKTCRLETAIKQGEASGFVKGTDGYSQAIYDFLTDYGLRNLKSMYQIVIWSVEHNIYFYRMSSDMFPHINNPRIWEHMNKVHCHQYFTLRFASHVIYEIGKYVQKYQVRLTMHPGHYNQIGSPTKSVVQNTLNDLAWHARLLDLLERGAQSYIDYKLTQDSNYNLRNILHHGILCLHGGGTYKDKPAAIQRWKHNFSKFPEFIRKRVCLENCEKGYSVEDLLPICQELQIPLILDFHHYACWAHFHSDDPGQKSLKELLPRVLATWEVRNIRPKFHLSDQAADKKVGAHHDYVASIPDELIALKNSGYTFDIMIEAKKKELATIQLQEKYRW